MSRLINEARSLIAKQGDEYQHENSETKKKYENENALSAIRDSINVDTHPMLINLGAALLKSKVDEAGPKPSILDGTSQLSVQNLQAWLDQGMIYVRGIKIG